MTVVVLTAAAIYFGGLCCPIDLGPEFSTPAEARTEPENTLQDSLSGSENLLAYRHPETVAGKMALVTSQRKNKNNPAPIELLVTGQIQTEKGYYSGSDRIEIHSPSLDKTYITKSNGTGYFQIDSVLSAADYRLRISPKGMYRKYHEEVSITPTSTQFYILLESMPVSNLRGQIRNLDNVPVIYFKLNVKSLEVSRWGRNFTTDSVGGFQLEGVPVGRLVFTTVQDQKVLSIKGFELPSNQQQAMNLIVDEGPYTINGTVNDHYGEPVAGANVLLSWNYNDGTKRSTVLRTTTTKLDGRFQLQGNGPGLHELVIADTSSWSAHKQSLDLLYDFTEVLINLKP